MWANRKYGVVPMWTKREHTWQSLALGKKHVVKILAAAAGLGTAVIGGVTLVATLSCGAAASGDPFAEYDCYKIAAFGGSFTLAAGRVTVAAWENTP